MSNEFDFNNADEQFDPYALIPEGTFAKLTLVLIAESSDGLTQSKTGNTKYLKCEITVVDGKYNNKKFFSNLVVSGGKTDSNGNSIAGNISRSTLRAILESARNINVDDPSDNAVAARQVNSYFDFDGMSFVAEIGIQKAIEGSGYDDQNRIKKVTTPDMKEYVMIKSGQEVPAKSANKAASTKQETVNPAWANNTTDNEAPPLQDEVPPASTVPAWAQ